MRWSTPPLSSDQGATWARLQSLEPSNALASHASSLIPSPPGSAAPGRVYALYDYNLHNVTHLPSGKKCSRYVRGGMLPACCSTQSGTCVLVLTAIIPARAPQDRRFGRVCHAVYRYSWPLVV